MHPKAILGMDVLCQAKSCMGKNAVFALASPQQIDASETAARVLVVGHTRDLAYRIKHALDRIVKYFQDVKTGVVYGAPAGALQHLGRMPGLLRRKDLDFSNCTQFLDEGDKCMDKSLSLIHI